MRISRKLANYAWFVLIYNIGVVLFGAYVRISRSGAGCGSHWPLCNGVVIPRPEQIETLIEFTHRLTSGLSLPLVIVLLIWAYRAAPRGHQVRLGASFSLLFIVTEALVGAGLVLGGWVVDDTSVGRVVMQSIHLVNTFLLLGSLALTARWASGGGRVRLQRNLAFWALLAAMLGVVMIGVTGAITALGDTIFPSASFLQGVQQDFSPTAHFLIRLRVWHPVAAATVGFYSFFVGALLALFRSERSTRRLAMLLIALFGVQLVAGLINLFLNAPLVMQIIHLFLADMVWISLILLTADVFATQEAWQPETAPQAISPQPSPQPTD